MKIKTSELTGAALDWAVAQCEYNNKRYHYGSPCFSSTTKRVYETAELQKIGVAFAPSEDWKQGGPIIEREGLVIRPQPGTGWDSWEHGGYTPCYSSGPTPLIAAMRCYVASKLGNEVDVPGEIF